MSYMLRGSTCYFVVFTLRIHTGSILCLRNNWAPLLSLLRFTTFYWNTPSMNFKGISIVLWSPNISSINNLFIKMEPKLVSESQCEQLSGCSMPEAAQSNQKNENLRSKEKLRHHNLTRSTGSTSLPLQPRPEYSHMMANEMLQSVKCNSFP